MKYQRIIMDGISTEYYVSKNGVVISKYRHKETRLKVFETKKGYQYVKFTINGKGRAAFLHRLVAMTYIDNPENKPEVNHKDGNKHNNNVSNLEWVTSKENKKHAKESGLLRYASGENSGNSLYTNTQVEKACKLMEKNELTLKEISKKSGIGIDTLYYIRSKKGWYEISKKYNFPKHPLVSSKAYDLKTIKKVCKLLEKGVENKKIVVKTGVKIGTVKDIKNRRRWEEVSKLYKF